MSLSSFLKCSFCPYLDSKLSNISNESKITQIEVMVLRSWCKNRKAAATSQRSNVATLQRDVETQHLDVTTLPNDVTTFEVGFGSIFNPF